MAIIEGVEITVSCGGNPLQEYAAPIDDDVGIGDDDRAYSATIVKYIEAIPGANFAIHYSVKGERDFGKADYLALGTWIDGLRVNSPVVMEEQYDPQQGYSGLRDGKYVGSRQKRPFHWTELLTTDERPEGTVEEVKAKYAKLGTIRVEFSRKLIVSRDVGRDLTTLTEKAIPEKALKGQPLELGLRLGKAVTVRSRAIWKGKRLDDHPIAICIFHYRSKNALQILGILPRTPEPIPLEDRDPESLTREELVELARRQQAQREAEKVKIKREKTEANLRDFAATAIKRTVPGQEDGGEGVDDEGDISIISPPKKRLRGEPETIDLTAD